MLFCRGLLPAEPGEDPVLMELMLASPTPRITDCDGEEVEIALLVRNPGGAEIRGVQAFIRYPAPFLEPLEYQELDLRGITVTNGPEPFGMGFPGCDRVGVDPWDDGLGMDVVAIISFAFPEEEESGFIQAGEANLGAFRFRRRGGASPPDLLEFSLEYDSCRSSFQQGNYLFDPAGDHLEVIYPVPSVQVEIQPAARVQDLDCSVAPSGKGAVVSWSPPGEIDGVNLYRDGELIRALVLPFVQSVTDAGAPSKQVVYEVAVIVEGEEEACRTSCSIDLSLQQAPFRRGDANGDEEVNISDVFAIIGHQFQGQSLSCPDAADVDDDGELTLTDITDLLDFLYRDGSPLPSPFPGEGMDPTPDDLPCFWD